eukprot:1141011-Pelagomonas_calceolata.AAC.1
MSVFVFNGTAGRDLCGSIPRFFRLIQGVGSLDSPTCTQKDWVEGGLAPLKLFSQFTVMLL